MGYRSVGADPSHIADRDLLADAAREAGRIALAFRDKGLNSWEKAKGDPVSDADLAADTYLQSALRQERPDYGWLSEETKDDRSRLEARRSFVVDPIDGTRAFIKNRPEFAVSIAVIEDGAPICGVIFDPSTDIVYDAVLGGGARANAKPIRVSHCTALSKAHIYGDPGQLPALRELGVHADTINSVALRLAHVASGERDGLAAVRGKWDWDLAAAALLVTEAGGLITDHKGAALSFNDDPPRQPAPLAAGPALHALLRQSFC